MTDDSDRTHRHHLRRAALLALRGHGGVAPNPMVGCVIVSRSGETVGWGYHRRVGEAHAEIIALQRAGPRARGAALYCTLEPCNHTGRTGPCAQAIIEAGVARVLVAHRDPWPQAAGGLEALRAAGIEARVIDRCEFAAAVSEPFAHRIATGLPWVTVKWAQTLDGRIATAAPACESQWISSEASRRMVHRERGRVDAILTGVGTVLKDDPLLTPRGGGSGVRLRRPGGRMPLRVIVDPDLRTPPEARIVATAAHAPTLIACAQRALERSAAKADALRERGVSVFGLPPPEQGDDLPLTPLMKELASRRQATHVMVEAGAGLMSRLFRQRLVNEAWIFTAPLLLGDAGAMAAVTGMNAQRLTDGVHMQLWSLRRRAGDVIARYRVCQR